MSDLIKTPQLLNSKDCPLAISQPIQRKLTTHIAKIGESLTIRRALPHRDKKTIGAWCFFDHFGPLDLKNSALDIAPHPHIGLQTFTWTISGEILHRDSIGSKQVIQPGQVNLMTAGKGIAHSEESLPDSILHGVQLWIALPDAVRHMEPQFNHYPAIPSLTYQDFHIHVLAGEFLNYVSPAHVYSPLVGLELKAVNDTATSLPLNPAFEYGILSLTNTVDIGTESIGIDTLLYLGCGHSTITIHAKKETKILIIGGEPFNEEILIWWNFVGRHKDEFVQAAQDWNNGNTFGEVKGYQGDRLTAPQLS